jgi:hypothetical protein
MNNTQKPQHVITDILTTNWTYQGIEITSASQIGNPFGFVYLITNLDKKMIYVGSKQIVSKIKKKFGKRKIATITDKRLKKYEYIVSEAKDWQKYVGSSKQLQEDLIQKKHRYTKEILYLCESKTELKFREVSEIICSGAMENDMSYNANISIKQVGKLNFNK